jgi:hypothetical protein
MRQYLRILAIQGTLFVYLAAFSDAQTGAISRTNESIAEPKIQNETLHPNRAQGSNYKVTVISVEGKSTPYGKAIYQISYTYEFKGRDSIYIRGLGTVPSNGAFSYMVSELYLEFRDPINGSIIANVHLEETARSLGADSTDMPKETDFPLSFRSDAWSPSITFPGVATRIIQRYFPSGYKSQQSGEVNYYLTTYRNLQVTDQNLRSQIAVNISQPYDIAGETFNFRIQFVTRDRPRLSDTWRYGDERNRLTIIAAEKFIDRLIEELTIARRKQSWLLKKHA